MTESKHSQEIRTGLPEKKWFRLEEVADRWSELTGQAVTVDDVLHYEEIEELRIAVLLRYDLFVKCQGAGNLDKAKEIEEKFPFSKEMRRELTEERLKYRLLSGMCYPFTDISRQLMNGNEVNFYLAMETEEAAFTSDFLYIVDGWFKEDTPTGEPLLGVSVHRDDLRITRIERDRFEQKHGIGKPAPMPIINDEAELKRAYRALGALAMQLAKEKTKFMNGENPNASQIAKYALNAVSDSEGHAMYGYGETVLRDVITTALNAVNKDLSNR